VRALIINKLGRKGRPWRTRSINGMKNTIVNGTTSSTVLIAHTTSNNPELSDVKIYVYHKDDNNAHKFYRKLKGNKAFWRFNNCSREYLNETIGLFANMFVSDYQQKGGLNG